MLQRIQSVYLFLSAVCMAVCLSLEIALFEGPSAGAPIQHMYNMFICDGQNPLNFVVGGLAVALVAGIILTLLNIFGYKNLKKQSRQCLLTMMLLVLWVGGYALMVKVMCPEGYTTHIEIPAALPLVALIFQVLARRGVKHDQAILKAADRIR